MGGSLRCAPTALLVALALAGQARGQVAINEVLYDPEGPDAGLEFVEIMNCGHAGVLLTGWVLETGNGASQNDWTVEWIGGDFDYLEPGGILLIGEEDVRPAPDHVTSLDLQNGPDGIRLTDGAGVVDVVGWGDPLFHEYYEGSPAPDAPLGSSLARSPDCWDHDVNADDFSANPVPTPGARNALAFDLSLGVRHPGRTIFEEGSTVLLAALVRNVGATSTAGYEPRLRLHVDGEEDPTTVVALDRVLEPRDSLEVDLSWAAPDPGHHAARLNLRFAPDGDRSNNERETSFAVGGPGGHVIVNEIFHSPGDGGSEWVELVNASGDTVALDGWMLGDDADEHALVPLEGDTLGAVPPGWFLVVAHDAAALAGELPSPVVESDGWEALSADDTIALLDRFGTPVDLVAYERQWGGERGVSLERVRPDMPSGDPNNWGSSVAPEGSTPGRENSIHVAELPASGTLVVAPNPITPNGDGVDDRALIRFELPVARATVRLTVFDLTGRSRGMLLDHEAVGNRGELIWDGSAPDGSPLPTGLYVLLLEAIDARQGVLVNAKAPAAIVR